MKWAILATHTGGNTRLRCRWGAVLYEVERF